MRFSSFCPTGADGRAAAEWALKKGERKRNPAKSVAIVPLVIEKLLKVYVERRSKRVIRIFHVAFADNAGKIAETRFVSETGGGV
jgi:hypothetical protein